jgi:hypothetical protein
MRRRVLRTGLIGAGVLLLVPGIIWITTSGSRLNDDDAYTALQPLLEVPLDSITDNQLSESLHIPETEQWVRIRKLWGEPDFVISIIDQTGRNAICLTSAGFQIEVKKQNGGSIPLLTGGPPYGYSDFCAGAGLRFRATPGEKLELTLRGERDRAPSRGASPHIVLRGGELIVVPNWWNTKDKLVSVSLDNDISTLLKWASVSGVVLVLMGASLIAVKRVRRHH